MTLTKTVDQMTILQGDRPRLKELLKVRLTECGWTDQVRLLCRECVEEHGSVNVDAIVQSVTPTARQLVPNTIKKELLQKIKYILQNHDKLNNIQDINHNGNNNNNNNNNADSNATIDGPSGGGIGIDSGGGGVTGNIDGGSGGGVGGTAANIGDGDGEGDIDAYAEIIRNASDNIYRYVNEDHRNWAIEQENRIPRNGIEIDNDNYVEDDDDDESIADSPVM